MDTGNFSLDTVYCKLYTGHWIVRGWRVNGWTLDTDSDRRVVKWMQSRGGQGSGRWTPESGLVSGQLRGRLASGGQGIEMVEEIC